MQLRAPLALRHIYCRLYSVNNTCRVGRTHVAVVDDVIVHVFLILQAPAYRFCDSERLNVLLVLLFFSPQIFDFRETLPHDDICSKVDVLWSPPPKKKIAERKTPVVDPKSTV